MKTHTQWWNWAVIAVALAFMLQAPLELGAQDTAQDDQSNSQDPPSRVARLDYIEGSVSFQPGGENDWIDAELNRPLATGDNLWADENSRAEAHIGSTALRLGAQTGVTLLEMSDQAAQIRLAQGSLIVRVLHVDDSDTYEIDTPNVAFTIQQPGEYRLDVNPDGTLTEIGVFRGRGQATGGGSSFTVVAGQDATFSGTDQLNYDLGQLPASDGFDSWAFQRDRMDDDADAANYVSREMTGYEDLDEYGDWTYIAGYGPCWRPRGLVVGWAPYRFGHWAWVAPWGWTWVEAEPWGFAPFHYGRWAYTANGWFWVPGPAVVRPVYAPALVAWVGGGPGFGFSFSFGAGVGWFPLAPGEVFIPAYRVSNVYVNRVNITNTAVTVTKVTNVYNTVVVNRNVNNITYANRNVSGGVTVVSRDTFVNARPVAGNVVSVSARELASAPVSHAVAAQPVRASVVGEGGVAVSKPPAVVTNRQVVAVRTPAPMPRSFEQQRANEAAQQSLVRQQAPGRPVQTSPQTNRQAQSDQGFRPFTPPSGSNNQGHATRVWEAQGTPEPERPASNQAANSISRPNGNPGLPQPSGQQPAQQWSHPLAKPAPPVSERNEQQQKEQEQKFSNWQQQKSSSPPPQRQQNSHPSAQNHESTPKKGH